MSPVKGTGNVQLVLTLNSHQSLEIEIYIYIITTGQDSSASFIMFCLFSFTFLHMVFAKREVLNPIALRKAKIAYNFGLSECNRVKIWQITLFSVTLLPWSGVCSLLRCLPGSFIHYMGMYAKCLVTFGIFSF